MKIERIFEDISLEDVINIPEDIISKFRNCVCGKKVIIYGAALIGSVLYRCLCKLGIEVACIVDRDAERIGNIDGFAVEIPDDLPSLIDKTKEYVIIFAVSERTAITISNDFTKIGIECFAITNGQKVVDCLQSAICTINHKQGMDVSYAYCGDCSILDNVCTVLRLRAKDEVKCSLETSKSQRTTMIGYALSNVCTLNCKFCCESIPLHEKGNRHFVETETVIKDIFRVAEASECITIIEFIGGEPFLHKGLPKIIDACLTIPNAAYIHIFTNGTVVPQAELTKALQNQRVSVYISNYTGFLTEMQEKAINETKQILTKNGVLFLYGGEKKWFDFSEYTFHNDSDDLLSKRFNSCFLHNCNRLHNGILYVCPHHYAGTNLGKLKESNTVHIHKLSDDELVNALDNFKQMPFVEACRYCSMPDNAKVIMPANQGHV